MEEIINELNDFVFVKAIKDGKQTYLVQTIEGKNIIIGTDLMDVLKQFQIKQNGKCAYCKISDVEGKLNDKSACSSCIADFTNTLKTNGDGDTKI